MVAAVAITRKDYTAEQLRAAAKRTKDAGTARRMLALALVLEGKSRIEAATSCGMDRQILCDWVHRYNAEGIEGLRNRTAPGAKPKLSAEQECEVAELVRKGPDLAEHGVVRWRRIDLARVIEQRYGVKFAERSIGDLLRRLAFGGYQCDPGALSRMPRCRKRIKKLCRSGRGCHPSARVRQTDRTLVAG
jgi:transposase